MMYNFLLIGLVAVWTCIRGQDNILINPGFEEPLDGSNWYCVACTLTQDPDAYEGSYSGFVSDRTEVWSSVSQDTPLESNMRYLFSAYVKLAELNEGALWHQVDMLVELDVQGSDPEYMWFGRMPYLKLDQGWVKIGGDFWIDDRTINNFRLYVQMNVEGETPVSYRIDSASLVAVPDNPNWKEEANTRIEEIRKNDVTINLSVTGDYDPANLEIKVNQTSQAYPFGSCIVDGQIAGDDEYNQRYQDCYYTHFNWAVYENALKWQSMEPVQGQITFPDESMRRLSENGIPTRGHCVFWGVDQFVPEWLKSLPPNEVLSEIQRRIDYVVPRYADTLIHWDVNNEYEHGSWFESTTGQPYIMNDMFTDVRARDSDVRLFLNDYEIVSGSGSTQSYISKAIEVNDATGEVAGVGIQSHIVGNPDIHAIQLRLDVVAGAGFPIWITELDVELQDKEQRANGYDDLVTLYYSNPNVEGILLWGFCDLHHWRPEAALFEGEYFEPNAAGLRWQEMMFSRWRTYETFLPTSTEESFQFRGFHGSYIIQVLNNGAEVTTQTFDLQPGQDISVDVEVQ